MPRVIISGLLKALTGLCVGTSAYYTLTGGAEIPAHVISDVITVADIHNYTPQQMIAKQSLIDFQLTQLDGYLKIFKSYGSTYDINSLAELRMKSIRLIEEIMKNKDVILQEQLKKVSYLNDQFNILTEEYGLEKDKRALYKNIVGVIMIGVVGVTTIGALVISVYDRFF